MMAIEVNRESPAQSVNRVLQMAGDGKALPWPHGYDEGGEYSATETTNPAGVVETWLYYAEPGGQPVLLGKVPAARGGR